MLKKLALCFIFLYLSSSLCFATDDYYLQKVEGLKSIKVCETGINSNDPGIKLISERIKNIIELKLRQCSIDVKKSSDYDAEAIFLSPSM